MINSNRLAFVDADPSSSYDFETQDQIALGQEPTALLSVASGLAQVMTTSVWQAGRKHSQRAQGITFRPYRHRRDFHLAADYIVVVGNPKVLTTLREHNPTARLFLWLQSKIGKHHKDLAAVCKQTQTTLIAASKFLRDEVTSQLRHQLAPADTDAVVVECIYNPVLLPPLRTLPWDEDKLIYLGEAADRLPTVLEYFQYCRQAYPMLRLYMFEPASSPFFHQMGSVDGVINLGALPRREVLEHLGSAFCLFSPGGDIYDAVEQPFAAANALSVPVIAADVGAAGEIIQGCRSQVLLDSSLENVLATIGKWRRQGRPLVRMRKAFRIEAVSAAWMRVLLDSRRGWPGHRGALIPLRVVEYPEARHLPRR